MRCLRARSVHGFMQERPGGALQTFHVPPQHMWDQNSLRVVSLPGIPSKTHLWYWPGGKQKQRGPLLSPANAAFLWLLVDDANQGIRHLPSLRWYAASGDKVTHSGVSSFWSFGAVPQTPPSRENGMRRGIDIDTNRHV